MKFLCKFCEDLMLKLPSGRLACHNPSCTHYWKAVKTPTEITPETDA